MQIKLLYVNGGVEIQAHTTGRELVWSVGLILHVTSPPIGYLLST